MRNRTFLILTAWMILLSIHLSATGDTYQKARARLESASRPWFVERQLDREAPFQVDEAPQAVLFSEVELLLNRYDEQRDSSLRPVIEAIEPVLFQLEGLRIQGQAEDGGVEALLSGSITIETVLNAAYFRNPLIQSASQAWQAALERYPQAAYLEGILRQYNAFTKRLDLLLSGMQRQKSTIDSRFPFPGVTALRGDIIEAEIETARQDFAITLRDVLADVKKTFYDIVYIREAIALTRENQTLLEQMLDVASQKFESGSTAYNDVIKARVALSQLTDNLITLENRRETAIARLNTLMDRHPNAPIGTLVSPPVSALELSLEGLQDLAQQHRQEIRRMQSLVKRTRLTIDFSKEKNRPDPTYGASYFQDRSALLAGVVSEGEAFQPSPRQPLRPWFGQREAFIVEMQQREIELQEKLEDTLNQTRFEVTKAYFSLDAAYRESELFRTTLIPEARQSLEVSETDYLGTRIGFLDYLDAQRTWLDFNLSYLKARRDYGITHAELERVTGFALPAHITE